MFETHNADQREIAKFNTMAHSWWDANAEFKILHDINQARVDWIDRNAALHGKLVLDVGCGGGLLSEAMASKGARVTGIDMSEDSLAVARLHLAESGRNIDYRLTAVEELEHDATETSAGIFDVITCMEMLEHVPDPSSVVAACARLVKPGGQVFLSTISRTFKAYLLAVIGAEYLFNMLPKGTHDYAKFLQPAELAAFARHAGLEVAEIIGLSYNPFTRNCRLSDDPSINYLMRARHAQS